MKLLSILVFICIATAAYAQVDIEAIKRDSNYIFGQGEGATTREADNEALRVISSQIWTFISQGTDSRATVAVDGNSNHILHFVLNVAEIVIDPRKRDADEIDVIRLLCV